MPPIEDASATTEAGRRSDSPTHPTTGYVGEKVTDYKAGAWATGVVHSTQDKMEVKKWWILVCFSVAWASAEVKPWAYQCDEFKRCIKTSVVTNEAAASANGLGGGLMSLGECKLTCCDNTSVLWPKPRSVKAGKTVTAFPIENIEFSNQADLKSREAAEMLQRNINDQVQWLAKKKASSLPSRPPGVLLSINVNLRDDSHEAPRINRKVNESYELKISYQADEKRIQVDINSECFFGARHGLETLFQLIEYDDIARGYIILNDVEVQDEPEFRHRGISLDSSRNFMTVDVIKRLIDGMSASKLNVFHWHLVDTHSYPVEQKQEPINQMAQLGAYGADKIYTQKQIKDIVAYANLRGVRVIPEFDQPAHVGNGWQFPGAEKYTVCVNQEPWYDYCVEPPCGQLNPTEPGIYDILEKIYQEWYEMFQFDSFHMGADEVNFGCWNSSHLITDYMDKKGIKRDKSGFIRLWDDFQKQSSERLRRTVDGKVDDLEIIVWNSKLTKPDAVDKLSKDEYVIQLWNNSTDTEDPEIKTLADKGYKMIFSNFDKLYLDCGYGAWVGEGNNWCSPYKGWQGMYDFDLYEVLKNHKVELTDYVRALVLGGEVAMWSEQVDTYHVEGKIFPRAAALAERLWSNPTTGWYDAESRMLEHRRRLVQRGVNADALQPEWCRQNEGQCYIHADNPHNKED